MQTRNARIETLGGAIVRFPFGVTVRRALVAVCGFAALTGCATLVGCSSDEEEEPAVVEEPQDPEETQVSTEPGIPITITAEYAPGTNLAAKKPIPLESVTEEGYAQKNRIAFTDNGTDVSAVWEAGDQIYVVCNGKISLLSLESGAGTNKGTFVGDLAGYSGDNKPAVDSELICWVKNRTNKNFVLDTDGTIKRDLRNFMAQSGTLTGAAQLTNYRGTAKYGTGSNIVVDFKIHDTCLMKFEIEAKNGVQLYQNSTVTYRQGDLELATCSRFAAKNAPTTYYLSVIADVYEGAATLGYTNQMLQNPHYISLGTNKYSVTLETGKYYVKTGLEPNYALGDYFYEYGQWGDVPKDTLGNFPTAQIISLNPTDTDKNAGYTNGYACAYQQTPYQSQWTPTATNMQRLDFTLYNIWYSGRTQSESYCQREDDACNAAKIAASYKERYPDLKYWNKSDWFLPSYRLAALAQQMRKADDEIITISEYDAESFYTSKENVVKKMENIIRFVPASRSDNVI